MVICSNREKARLIANQSEYKTMVGMTFSMTNATCRIARQTASTAIYSGFLPAHKKAAQQGRRFQAYNKAYLVSAAAEVAAAAETVGAAADTAADAAGAVATAAEAAGAGAASSAFFSPQPVRATTTIPARISAFFIRVVLSCVNKTSLR